MDVENDEQDKARSESEEDNEPKVQDDDTEEQVRTSMIYLPLKLLIHFFRLVKHQLIKTTLLAHLASSCPLHLYSMMPVSTGLICCWYNLDTSLTNIF